MELTIGNVQTGEKVMSKTFDELVTSLAISITGEFTAIGLTGGLVEILNTDTGNCVQTLTDLPGEARSTSFSPDGKHLASAAYSDVIKIWDFMSGPSNILGNLKGKSVIDSKLWRKTASTIATNYHDSFTVRRNNVNILEIIASAYNSHSTHIIINTLKTFNILGPIAIP